MKIRLSIRGFLGGQKVAQLRGRAEKHSTDALIRTGLLPAIAPERNQPGLARSNSAGSPIPADIAAATGSSKPSRPTLFGLSPESVRRPSAASSGLWIPARVPVPSPSNQLAAVR